MSAEAFQTLLSCDARSSPDGRGAEYAEAFTQQPRWLNSDGTINRDSDEETWAAVMLHAETAIHLAARAIREQPMDGLTGDYPWHRKWLARELERLAAMTRLLALDHACDGVFNEEKWKKLREELG